MPDFHQLISPGAIGFYLSCEVTQIFLLNRKTNRLANFYILACLEEKPYSGNNHRFLGKPFPINSETSLCMQRYYCSIAEVTMVYQQIINNKVWDYNGNTSLQLGNLKQLSKQFIPSAEGNRLSQALKNNFHSGSYVVEFFDEEKINLSSILNMEVKKLDALSGHIYNKVPIDLSVVRDRIGNIIFQFPITIVEVATRSLKTGDGIELNFSWHNQLTSVPDCEIQIESSLDKNLMSAVLETYNKTEKQEVITGNSDSINNIRLWEKSHSLLLSNFSGTYLKGFNIDMRMQSPEPRIFELGKKQVTVSVASKERSRKKDRSSYTSFISAQMNNAEKKALAKNLSFKQYNNYGHDTALQDLRSLIQSKDSNGVYLWDPFLTAEDILKTLYFSTTMGVKLKAIGSIDKTVKRVYKIKTKTLKQIVTEQSKLLNNPKNNNYGLNLEFRMQYGNHGWHFHDRFLIFPGDNTTGAQVYSLGTSINSFGKKHHILQEVLYAQPVIDAFNDLWTQLDKPACIVWKYPKP